MTSQSTHYNIVHLQGDYCPFPDFDLPAPYTYTKITYPQTPLSELHARVHDASIIVLCRIKLDALTLSPEVTPHLKFIAVVAAGYDCVDMEACRVRGIVVSNCPGMNIEAVSEHAIGLYFMTRRKMLSLHTSTMAGKWMSKQTLMYEALEKDGQPPLSCKEEVVGIVGNGNIGKRIAFLARTLGMTVLISGRKGPNASSSSNGTVEERVLFEDIIKRCTVIFLALPLTNSTRNLISTPELQSMSPYTIIVNVSRGGIVDEEALVQALKERRIAGAATDVFDEEPAGLENCPLLGERTKDLNLVVTPHLAWLTRSTKANYGSMLKNIVEEWCAGRPCNVVG